MQPYITITAADGSARRIAVRTTRDRDGNIRAVPIAEQPSESIPTPIIFGNTEQRSNLDVSQIIFSDWRGGMGREEYTETEGISDFQFSECDTRYAGVLVCPPAVTTTSAAPITFALGARVVYLGYTNADFLVANRESEAATYLIATDTWTHISNDAGEPVTVIQVAQGLTGTFLVSASSGSTRVVYRTTDGVTWTDITGSGLSSSDLPRGLAIYDNKVCVIMQPLSGFGLATLYTSTDAHTSSSPTWTARETFYCDLSKNERPLRLFVWVSPYDPDTPALWVQTQWRLWYWDDTAPTPTWKHWKAYQFPSHSTSSVYTFAHQWVRTGNQYIAPGINQDFIFEYAGPSTEGVVGPNVRGGLPAGAHMQPSIVEGNGHWLFAFGWRTLSDTASNGGVYAMNDQQGWHNIGGTLAGTSDIFGGGVGPDTIYVAHDDDTVKYLPLPDESDIPQHATGRTYATGAHLHYTAITDGGTKLLDKQLLWFHVDADVPDGAQIRVGYRADGATSTTWAGTIDDNDTLPAIINIATEVVWKRLQVVIELTRGTATSATPVVRSVGLNYTRVPKVRFGYSVSLDLSEDNDAFGGDVDQFNGHTRHSLRNWLRALAGKLVRVDFGGMLMDGFANTNAPGYTSITRAQLAIVPSEDPISGVGFYIATFFDLQAPQSG